MSYMKISIRFRRETGADCLAVSLFDIFINDLFNKIFGNSFVFHSQSSSVDTLFGHIIYIKIYHS